MQTLLDVIRVEPRQDHTLLLEFENHEIRLFDMTPYLEKKPYTRLNNSQIFMCATIDYGTVVWPGNIDIAPETLWDHSTQTTLNFSAKRDRSLSKIHRVADSLLMDERASAG